MAFDGTLADVELDLLLLPRPQRWQVVSRALKSLACANCYLGP